MPYNNEVDSPRNVPIQSPVQFLSMGLPSLQADIKRYELSSSLTGESIATRTKKKKPKREQFSVMTARTSMSLTDSRIVGA